MKFRLFAHLLLLFLFLACSGEACEGEKQGMPTQVILEGVKFKTPVVHWRNSCVKNILVSRLMLFSEQIALNIKSLKEPAKATPLLDRSYAFELRTILQSRAHPPT